MIRIHLKSLGISVLGILIMLPSLLISKVSDSKAEDRPNIIIIFADDMGYSDIGCFGGEIETPNLDALAAGGVRFTQFYNTARCCPSRASLLTGLYPHQAGMGMMVYRDYGEGYRGNLNDQCVTFGEVLQQAGYQTMLVGKWHAGHRPHSRPEVRGFDKFTGIYPHIDSYWKVLAACDIYRDKKLLIPAGENPINPYRPGEEFYTTDFFTDNAIDYINQAQESSSNPFLLHICYNVPHFPLETPEDLIQKYRGKYLKGWDKLREEKLKRMKQMGIVGEDQKLPRVKGFEDIPKEGFDFKVTAETPYLPEWDSLSEDDQDELDFRRAMYAGQIDNLDQNVGRIVEHLKNKNILDNTIILFFSDNGCSGELHDFGMNWGKYTSKNYQEWRKKGGWSISQGQCWASYSNTPLRKYKKYVHEGGTASPFIAHWPAGIMQKGEICTEQVAHLVDIMPTLCELSGATYPETFKNRKIKPAPGISLVPYLKNVSKQPITRTIYWQHETCAAIRQGDWKLVTTNDRDPDKWELYNLAVDRSETENLIEKNNDVSKNLYHLWNQWAQQSNVIPYPETRGELERNPWPPPPWPAEYLKD